MGNLNFAVAVNLLTENFKKGKNELLIGFQSIQIKAMEVAAAVGIGGLGLGGLISKMIEVSKESAAANQVLKNVSNSTAELAHSQKFLIEVANKYGLSINQLTMNYARFTQAAKGSGLATQDQQAIFSGFSSQIVKMGGSTETMQATFEVITKMMSMGTISSRNFLQMIKVLPGATNIFSKALGMTNSEFATLLKSGKALSGNILPKVAQYLTKVNNGLDTDTITASANKLSNAFEELTNSTGISNFYKSLLDKTTKIIEFVKENLQEVATLFISIVSGVIIGKGINAIINSYNRLAIIALRSYKKQTLAAGESFSAQEFAANKFTNVMILGFAKIKIAIASAFRAFAPMLIISGIIEIVANLIEWAKKQKEINNEYKEYQRLSQNIGSDNPEIQNLKNLKKILDDSGNSFESRKKVLNELNDLLGSSGSISAKNLKIEGDINKKYAERIKLIENQAKIQYYTDQKLKAQDKIKDLKAEFDDYVESNKSVVGGLWHGFQNTFGENKAKQISNEMLQQFTISNDAEANIKSLNKQGVFIDSGEGNGINTNFNSNKNNKKESESEKIESNYKKQKTQYDNQLKNNVINQKEYNSNIDELNKSTYNKLGAELTPQQVEKNKTYISAKKGVDNPLTSEIQNVTDNYNTNLNNLNKLKKDGIITESEYNNELNTLIDSTLKSIDGIKNVNIANNVFAKSLLVKKDEINKADYSLPTYSTVDHTFDYKKTETEKTKDKIDNDTSFVDAGAGKFKDEDIKSEIKLADSTGTLNQLKEKFNNQADVIIDELNNKMKEVTTLEQAMKINQVKQDIKELQNQLKSGLYLSVKDVANGAKNLYEAFNAVKKTINDVHASGFEKFLSLWDAFTNTIDNIQSIIKLITELTTVINTLSSAKKAQAVLDNSQAATALSLSAATITANTLETGTNIAKGTSGAISSAAKIPFPLNLLSMAAAAAEAIALFGAIPKFADGGIVGGSSTSGDKLIARVNSGEMILNNAQQSTLFGLLNSDNITKNKTSKIEFVIDGKYLKATLDNYSRIKNRVI